MTALDRQRYPIGLQTFSELIEGNYVYVDKTDLVYKITHGDSKYIFLSRPRRFGKTLLVSTLEAYFSAHKELFKGLAVEKLETDWIQYPVLRFDMSTMRHVSKEELELELNLKLNRYEKVYGRGEEEIRPNQRLQGIVRRAYERTGKKVVVLIDEYDAPLLDVVHEEENLPELRKVMRNFYSPLKALDPFLRFVFLTGITKFSQMSIFSALNNIKNISMDKEYASLCGFTEEEILSQMPQGIDYIAQEQGITREEALSRVKVMYDGYHFTWPSPDIYNPYSLLNAFTDGELNSYWFGSGTPTYLLEMLRKFEVKPYQIGGRRVKATAFDAPSERMTEITPLLYQSGYITIQEYSKFSGLYTLDIPNTEVRVGLMESLLPYYVEDSLSADTLVGDMAEHIHFGRMNEALELMRKFLLTIPYTNDTDYEGHYQALLYVIFSMLGEKMEVEVHTVDGRIDSVLHTDKKIYVIELKLNGSADEAMRQIDDKDYVAKYALSGIPVIKVGINFDSKTKTISDWKIVE